MDVKKLSIRIMILFIALKLTGIIDWPWILVLSPAWAPCIFILVLFALIVIFGE